MSKYPLSLWGGCTRRPLTLDPCTATISDVLCVISNLATTTFSMDRVNLFDLLSIRKDSTDWNTPDVLFCSVSMSIYHGEFQRKS
jgi:hypothetical protein